MRFKHEPFVWPEVKQYRKVTRFLWFPMRLENETRWLERATWVEETVIWVSCWTHERTRWLWESLRWAEEENADKTT